MPPHHGNPISIHSARVGGDIFSRSSRKSDVDFNPLRPCGRRLIRTFNWVFLTGFQSTPPVWAETSLPLRDGSGSTYFNPLRPCGRRRTPSLQMASRSRYFNPLRPCGRRLWRRSYSTTRAGFQSTPPVWAETKPRRPARGDHPNFNPLRPCGRRPTIKIKQRRNNHISIHSARVGGDLSKQRRCARRLHFNPLRPCGRRL